MRKLLLTLFFISSFTFGERFDRLPFEVSDILIEPIQKFLENKLQISGYDYQEWLELEKIKNRQLERLRILENELTSAPPEGQDGIKQLIEGINISLLLTEKLILANKIIRYEKERLLKKINGLPEITYQEWQRKYHEYKAVSDSLAEHKSELLEDLVLNAMLVKPWQGSLYNLSLKIRQIVVAPSTYAYLAAGLAIRYLLGNHAQHASIHLIDAVLASAFLLENYHNVSWRVEQYINKIRRQNLLYGSVVTFSNLETATTIVRELDRIRTELVATLRPHHCVMRFLSETTNKSPYLRDL